MLEIHMLIPLESTLLTFLEAPPLKLHINVAIVYLYSAAICAHLASFF